MEARIRENTLIFLFLQGHMIYHYSFVFVAHQWTNTMCNYLHRNLASAPDKHLLDFALLKIASPTGSSKAQSIIFQQDVELQMRTSYLNENMLFIFQISSEMGSVVFLFPSG